MKFADYPTWGDEVVGGTHVHRADVGMHFPKDVYEAEASPLLGYGCGLPNCEYDGDGDAYVCETGTNTSANATARPEQQQQRRRQQQERGTKKRLSGLPALASHLRVEHGYALCDLCVDNKRDFVSRLARYTPRGLREHESVGDGDRSGFRGHPLCEFCRPLRFYDVVKLHEHLNREHYKCHVCDRSGRPNVFFKDYPSLERHFDGDHYLCRDPQCLASRFVVFENEIDLRGHEACVHGNANGGNTKIRLEFRIRRDGDANALRDNQSVPTGMDFHYGLDGEAFVPEALPDDDDHRRDATVGRQANEPEISHPAHAARTAELRAQAAMVRAREGGIVAAEAFPALGASDAYDPSSAAPGNGISSGTLVGWTSDGVRAVAAGAVGGGRGRAPAGLTRTAVGRVTEEEFPSLPPPPSSGGRGTTRNAIVGGIGRTTKRPTTAGAAPTGTKFSAVAASSGSTTAASMSSARSRAPAVDGENFPSLAEGPSRPFVPSALASLTSSRASVPNLTSSDNFPSLGGGPSATAGRSATRPNPYAAVEAHARKLNRGGGVQAPSFGSSDFPPPPSSSSSSSSSLNASKNAKVVEAFAPKKPPPLDNVLHFPPPPSSYSSSAVAKKAPPPFAESLEAGRETVQSLKQLLGAARYKRLRSATRDFASGTIPPERYVDEAASLFDGGIGDEAFWDNIVPLIRDIPNVTASNGAMGYLESIRLANEMQELEFGGGGGGGNGKKPTGHVLPTRKNKTVNSWGK
ncbi:hypothetical protein ACHAW5_002258 [Stephanodiscus triporus]|uniref:C2H2-type domain-containing protein n=1 Tax=Stephanodiscus triporus TaxID=2934178 RepID=A0ABD3MFR2_9STRA